MPAPDLAQEPAAWIRYETDPKVTVRVDESWAQNWLDLGYAMTVHKSQGSEYPAVIVPLHTQHFLMLQRNLLYTGITRGKRLVVIVGSRKALQMAVQRQDTARRCTALAGRLAEPARD